jgi:hypothetical protein
MKKKMVRYTLETLPPLTEAQRTSLKALSARPDIEIDTSDIPVVTDAEWAKTKRVRGHLYRPVKQIVTAPGRRRSGMAEISRPGLSIAHERHSSTRNAVVGQVGSGKMNLRKERPAARLISER